MSNQEMAVKRYTIAGINPGLTNEVTPPGFNEYVSASDYDNLAAMYESLSQQFSTVSELLVESQKARRHSLDLCEKAQGRLERLMAKHGY